MTMAMRSMRTSRCRIAIALGIGAASLSLTGCSTNLHPGNAAVVDGTSIGQGDVDSIIDAACSYTEEFRKQNAQVQQLDRAEYRGIFLTGLIQAQITEQAADDQGLSVSNAQVEEATVQSVTSIPDSMSDQDRAALTTYFDDQARIQILQTVIGRHADDASVTDGSQVSSKEIAADKPFMKVYFEKADVDVNPRYGQWNGSTLDAGSGSLSQLVSTPRTSASFQCG